MSRVRSCPLFRPPHAQLHPRVPAGSQSSGSVCIESTLCCFTHPYCLHPQTQTDSGGSLQGIKTKTRAEGLQKKYKGAGRRSPINNQILLIVKKVAVGVLNTNWNIFNPRTHYYCSVKTANRDTHKMPVSSCLPQALHTQQYYRAMHSASS